MEKDLFTEMGRSQLLDIFLYIGGFPGGSVVKNLHANAGVLPRCSGHEAGGGNSGQMGLATSVPVDHIDSMNLIFKATG